MTNIFSLPLKKENIDSDAPSVGIVHHIDGTAFNIQNPNVDHLDLTRLGRVMSQMCRFGGHTLDFYSVAQHSVLVAALAPKDTHSQKWALLHDADECCSLPDMPTPLKPLFPEFVGHQKTFGLLISKKHGLDPIEPKEVKHADNLAFALEKIYCMASTAGQFEMQTRVDAPLGISFEMLQPREARALIEDAFIRVFDQGLAIDLEWLSKREGFTISPEIIKDMDPSSSPSLG